MKCQSCNEIIDNDSKFCPSCGNEIKKTSDQSEQVKHITDLEKRLSKVENFLSAFSSLRDKPTNPDKDELYDEAAIIVQKYENASASLLQRTLDIGYARAARLLDELEEGGIVGKIDESHERKVIK